MDEVASVAAHEARNRVLVARLLAKGESLTDVRARDLFFYAPTPESGSALARDLQQLGLTAVTVRPTPDHSTWCVKGVLESSVEHLTSAAFTAQLVCVASRCRSEYDGWGTRP